MPDEGQYPVYSAAETAAVVLDFLTFLTTLHRDPDDLRLPPPGGWPGYSPENCAGFKSDLAVEVLRNLPYLDRKGSHEDSSGQIHYKSCLLDYTTFDSERLTAQEYLWRNGQEAVPDHVIILAEGRESGGRTLFLDVWEGKVFEVEIRGPNEAEGQDLREYFEDLKNLYRNLELIPLPGSTMIELRASGIDPETVDQAVSKEEVLTQDDPDWGSDLDIRYVRQLYRAFGWPDDFRRGEAFDELSDLIDERDA